VLAWALAISPAEAQQVEEEPPKRVLLLYSLGRNFSPFAELASGVQREISRQSPTRVEFFEASLESARFEESVSEGPFVDYLSALFRDHPLDLVVTIGDAAARFCLRHREDLFPSTPFLATGTERRLQGGAAQDSRTAWATVTIDLSGQAENILRLLPDTRDVVLITSASLGKFWLEEMRREFRPYADRVTVRSFYDLSLAEMEERVASLPANTVIVYGLLTLDGAGVVHERGNALDAIYAASNSPIFGLFDTEIGRGIVGGRLIPVGEGSRRAAEAALRILKGEEPESVAVEPVGMGSPIYDFRELQRWGLSERLLPPESTVLHRPPTAWQQHRGAILGGIGIMTVQTALIAALLVHRSRRRAAEEQGRDLTRRLLTAHEDERRRLARELHDDLSQRLARLAIDAGQMEQRLQTVDEESATPSVSDGLAQLSDDVHALSYKLHPSLIEDLGLVEALQAECERFSESEGIPVTLETTALEVKLTPESSLCLYRIAQEALRNASRHAGASQVTMSLAPMNGEVRLEVSDDGVGFEPSELPARASLGHASMKERVHLVRGRLQIRSGRGRGTTVVAFVPAKALTA
jgi:signal transduction histidine kinase